MGAWIEIKLKERNIVITVGRTPRWVRGLKYKYVVAKTYDPKSHPTMGAWIEMVYQLVLAFVKVVAPHDGCVD